LYGLLKTEERVWGNFKYFLKRRLSYFGWNNVKTRKERTLSFEKGKQVVKHTTRGKAKGVILRVDVELLLLCVNIYPKRDPTRSPAYQTPILLWSS